MKKESKNYKVLMGRFILVAIFFLLIMNRTFAQCVDSDPGSLCHTNINFDPACYAIYGGGSDITDLKQSGIVNVNLVTIDGAADATITSMTITDIIVKNAACGTIDGPYDADDFPANPATDPIPGYGITFENNEDEVIIRVTDPLPGAGINYAALDIGSHINFIVEAFNGETQVASRRYTFTIVGGSYILGDTHITTVDGVKYDFQAVGEFVALRADSADNFEIQTRQTAVATQNPGSDSYTGLSTCVSVNTAVAARVGKSRISYQPNIDGKPDSSGMQLRVNGKLTELGDNGLDLGSGGRIIKSPAGGGAIQIDFPDGASLIVKPAWWSSYNQWYLNLTINNTAATKGISGVIAYNDTPPVGSRRSKSWLPALPDGSSLGPMPESLHDRFVALYQTFADAWRVTDETSLFDYAPGTSTATFTNKNWPAENAQSCSVPGQTPKTPIELEVAEKLASGIVDPIMKANAIFDVMVTGEPTIANTYLLTQQIQTGTTTTRVNASKDTTKYKEPVTFTAIVARKFAAGKDNLTGSVEFTVDGKKFDQVKLEQNGRAILTTASLEEGQHQIVATFMPDSGSFSSSSLETTHTVIEDTPIWQQWWIWLLVLLIVAGLINALRKKKKNP
ncbi:MAG: Ig-like domain repeat protein [Cyclobacteriaceae bacterium]